MILIFLLYGLSFFCLGFAVLMEIGHTSRLPLSRHLKWLAAFGLLHSIVEWSDMLLLTNAVNDPRQVILLVRTILLPLSALALVRFGVGLILDAGPLPVWVKLIPVIFFVPTGLLLGYVLVTLISTPPIAIAADVWSRYLLYFPGNLLASLGMLRQAHNLPEIRFSRGRAYLIGAAAAFAINAGVGGLVTPAAPYGLARWINYDSILSSTDIPVQLWRMVAAIGITYFTLKAMGLFEAERRQYLVELETQQALSQHIAFEAQREARRLAETWTEALVTISRCIAEMRDVDQVLLKIIETARQLLDSDTAVLGLLDDDRVILRVIYHASRTNTRIIEDRVNNHPIIWAALESAQTNYYEKDKQPSDELLLCVLQGAAVESAVIVPLKLDNQSVGALWIGRFNKKPFTTVDGSNLERLADQAVIAITHALLASKLQSMAVIEERSRIAREMHDGLSQILGYLRLETQTLGVLHKQANHQAVEDKLNRMLVNIDRAHADVRDNILSLRTTLSGDKGLVACLQDYLSEFTLQTNIQVHWICNFNGNPHLSPYAETQVLRMIQEALSNVRKHANADNVRVSLDLHGNCLNVTITDDGVGFDPNQRRGHYGMQTMHERANSTGGGLTITSQPGVGTQVEIWLPVVQEKI